jgi:hypothetical protein
MEPKWAVGVFFKDGSEPEQFVHTGTDFDVFFGDEVDYITVKRLSNNGDD